MHNAKLHLRVRINRKMKEYELHISLFQYYLTLGFSAVTFFYAITGGILAYILKAGEENPKSITFKIPFMEREWKVPMLKLSLLLPILLSNVFGCIFIYGAYKWLTVKGSIIVLRADLGIKKVPDLQILLQMLFLFGGIFFFVGFILLVFFFLKSPLLINLTLSKKEVASSE
jgi:cytochrome b subunit of formate dehydrogenase